MIEFLFAPTVPSAPSPKNRQAFVDGSATLNLSPTSSDVKVTSSTIPTVKLVLGLSSDKLSKTAFIWAGVVSLEDSPYLPPTITGAFSLSLNIDLTSKSKGSPGAPGSFVLS